MMSRLPHSRDDRHEAAQKRMKQRQQSMPGPGAAGSPKEAQRDQLMPPTAVKVTVAMLGIEVLGVAVAVVMSLLNLGQPGPLNLGGRIFMLVLIAGAGAGLTLVAIQHYLGKAFTRALIVVWQLFQLILGAQALGGGQAVLGGGIWLGLAMVIPAAVALVMVFSPATRLYLSVDDVPR